MTREAINELKKYTLGKKNTEKVEISVLQLNRVIKALAQEPCEDAISRQAVEKITWEEPSYTDALNVLTEVRDKVRALPSVNPQEPRWIPVSERLPDKLNDVLITFYDCPNEYDVAYLRTTFNESYKKSGAKNEWVSSMGETTYADYEVDAWMPIHPYKLESEE